jgi:hypothetical protein
LGVATIYPTGVSKRPLGRTAVCLTGVWAAEAQVTLPIRTKNRGIALKRGMFWSASEKKKACRESY